VASVPVQKKAGLFFHPICNDNGTMVLRVTFLHRELEHEVVFFATFRDHAPEYIGEVDLLPVDDSNICSSREDNAVPSAFMASCLAASCVVSLTDGWVFFQRLQPVARCMPRSTSADRLRMILPQRFTWGVTAM